VEGAERLALVAVNAVEVDVAVAAELAERQCREITTISSHSKDDIVAESFCHFTKRARVAKKNKCQSQTPIQTILQPAPPMLSETTNHWQCIS